jgi:uncharacterized Zn-binding protein involved in type VI secretion
MGNININGKTAVHAKSDGQLITTDTCMTPPYCIPINYTNQAESKMADMAASSVKVQGSPACNQKSNFKISKGDAPGACGGTSSGSVGQMAEFIIGSQDVTIEGKPAVRNGDKMVSNLKNTPPQPLQQPPSGTAPAGTAKAPAALTDFSQQFKCTSKSGEPVKNARYEIQTEDGQIVKGYSDEQGLTQRVFTEAEQTLEVRFDQQAWSFETDDKSCC